MNSSRSDNNKLTTWVTPAILLLIVVLTYGQTLTVPFYLDDSRALVSNYPLRDLPVALHKIFSSRGLTNLTFALNYRFSGWSLMPLHLVNIILHAGCGLLVWSLLRQLVRGPWLPLLGAALFLAHPLQTQAVTYVVQRATVLSTAFFLLAFLCHLRTRAALAAGHGHWSPAWLRPYCGALLCGACAVLSKENTATLPLALITYDWLFPLPIKRNRSQTAIDYLPFFVAPLFLGVGSLFSLGTLTGIAAPLASLESTSPLHYLVTEFSVVWVYLRLLFLPYHQALEYDFPVTAQLLTGQNMVALSGLLLLLYTVWRIRQRRPLLAFGVIWFLLALAVESTIIPLDPLFEHRLYLPMVGFVLVLLDGLPALLKERWVLLGLGSAVLVCAPLTWCRNSLWNEPVAFYEENLRVTPQSERVISNLANLYQTSGRTQDSLTLLESKVKAVPELYLLYPPLAKRYAIRGDTVQAFNLLEKAISARPTYSDPYETAAWICSEQGDYLRAADYLQRGIAAPHGQKARLIFYLGAHYSSRGERGKAEQAFLNSLALARGEYDRAEVYLNLAREYYYQEYWEKTLTALQSALKLMPGDPVALERLGEVALRLGDLTTAEHAATKLKYADRQAWPRLQAAIAQHRQGRG